MLPPPPPPVLETSVARPPIVAAADWGSQAAPIPDERRQVPAWITLHHAGTLWKPGGDPADFLRRLQRWGQNRPTLEPPPRNAFWPDVPYHFLIAPDGRIFEGRPVAYEPESNTRYAVAGNIGVEMMGDFERQRPSAAQLRACVALTAWLCEAYAIERGHVRGHVDAAPGQTTCPGKDFDRYLRDGRFARWLGATLEGRNPNVAPGPALPDGPANPVDGP